MEQILIVHLIAAAISIISFLILCAFDMVEITTCRVLSAICVSFMPIGNMMLPIGCFARIINHQLDKLHVEPF